MEREVQLSIYQVDERKKWAKGGKHARHLGKRKDKVLVKIKRKKYRLSEEERATKKDRCEDCGWDKPVEMYSVKGMPLTRPRLCTRCYEKQVRRSGSVHFESGLHFEQAIMDHY